MSTAHTFFLRPLFLTLAFAMLPLLRAQDSPKPLKAAATEEVATKTFDLKYADPEQIRATFAGRSFVMEANRDLKVLTVHGSAAFLKEVEDAVKRFDVAPPPPANLNISIYLLAVAEQAPTGVALPADLAALGKELSAAGSQPLKLADSQVLRIREGQSAETAGSTATVTSAMMSHVRLQSAVVTPSPKGDLVSLNGLRVWIELPAAAGEKSAPKTNPDVAADMDLEQNQVVMASKSGVDKPVVVVVRASVVR